MNLACKLKLFFEIQISASNFAAFGSLAALFISG
jgi:hypothetical protein